MPVQVAAYPQSIPVFTPKIDLTDIVFAAHINQLQLEVAALATALGTTPYGTSDSVKDRIASVETGLATITGYFDLSGNLPQAKVTGLVTALNTLTTEVASLTTSLATETTNRITADNNEAGLRAAAVTAEASARTSADNTEITARTNAVNSEASTRASAVTGLQNQINALPQGLMGSLAIGSTQTIGQFGQLLKDSVSSDVYNMTLSLKTGRKYLLMFTCGAIVDTQSVGGASHCSWRMRPLWKAGTGNPGTGDNSQGEIRVPLQAPGNSQDEGGAYAHHSYITVGSNGNYTFAVFGYCSRDGWQARLLSNGADSDEVSSVSSSARLSLIDLGAV